MQDPEGSSLIGKGSWDLSPASFAMWAPLLQVLLILGHVREALSACKSAELDFIVVEGDALLASLEDDVRSDLAKLGISVATRFLSKDDFNSNMTSGNFNLCFSETWGPPYDPHSFAAAWKSPDEAHFSALKGLQAPMTQDQLTTKVSDVLLEENLVQREQKWKEILTATHQQAIDLPFSGKRIPTVLSNRLAGYVAGQQQFDYPVHTLRTLSGSSTITVAPGAQTGLFDTVGRLDPHTYRPNEFFANNWVYEGLLTYGPGLESRSCTWYMSILELQVCAPSMLPLHDFSNFYGAFGVLIAKRPPIVDSKFEN